MVKLIWHKLPDFGLRNEIFLSRLVVNKCFITLMSFFRVPYLFGHPPHLSLLTALCVHLQPVKRAWQQNLSLLSATIQLPHQVHFGYPLSSLGFSCSLKIRCLSGFTEALDTAITTIALHIARVQHKQWQQCISEGTQIPREMHFFGASSPPPRSRSNEKSEGFSPSYAVPVC